MLNLKMCIILGLKMYRPFSIIPTGLTIRPVPQTKYTFFPNLTNKIPPSEAPTKNRILEVPRICCEAAK